MLKDRRQKAEALRYSVSKRWFPQLEVVVNPTVATSSRDYNLTDIDLLANVPGPFGSYQLVLFDCKTGSRNPPSARALWLRGLMDQVGASHGICILAPKKDIEADHRLHASQLSVTLLAEHEFGLYATATDGALGTNGSHAAQLEKWEALHSLPSRFPKLAKIPKFLSTDYWSSPSEAAACRAAIAIALEVRSELDPSKRTHLALFGDILALFLHAVARLAGRTFRAYLQPASRDDLARALLYLIYGGRDTYELFNGLRKLVHGGKEAATEQGRDLTLPNWDEFVEFSRALLDAPLQALHAPLLAREVAFSFLDDADPDHTFARRLASEHPQAAKFALLGARYLAKAARLPTEFSREYSSTLLAIQTPVVAGVQQALPLD